MTQAIAGCPCWWQRVHPGTSALFLLTHDPALDRIREAFAGTHAGLLVSRLDHQ